MGRRQICQSLLQYVCGWANALFDPLNSCGYWTSDEHYAHSNTSPFQTSANILPDRSLSPFQNSVINTQSLLLILIIVVLAYF